MHYLIYGKHKDRLYNRSAMRSLRILYLCFNCLLLRKFHQFKMNQIFKFEVKVDHVCEKSLKHKEGLEISV